MLAALFTTGIYIASHLTRDLVELGTQSGVEGIVGFTRMLHRILPDLESFDLTIQAVHGLPITPPDVAFAAIYGAAYTVVVLMLAAAIFERRDFR